MKISILCENQAGYDGAEVCLAEWGFSAFIETDNSKILFDTGHTDVYWKNAKQLGVDLENTDFVVLSHHHWDHSGGMRYHNFKVKKNLIVHPGLMDKLSFNESTKIKEDFKITTSVESLEFVKDVYYLGEIPRENDFEKGLFENDEMLDDSAIAIKTKNGVVVITGCSHSGICNICEYAKKITGQKLYAVIGGFHLFEDDQDVINKTIGYLQKEKPEFIYPMHCIDFSTLVRFYNVFKIKKLSAGDYIEIKD